MVTYLYWFLVLLAAGAVLFIASKLGRLKIGVIVALIVLFIGSVAYYFRFQQVFVKHYGGVMAIGVPAGQRHITATWKDEHLWIENYDPQTNTCYFNEYSKGNLLQGKVIIKNCSPIAADQWGQNE